MLGTIAHQTFTSRPLISQHRGAVIWSSFLFGICVESLVRLEIYYMLSFLDPYNVTVEEIPGKPSDYFWHSRKYVNNLRIVSWFVFFFWKTMNYSGFFYYNLYNHLLHIIENLCDWKMTSAFPYRIYSLFL